MMNTPGLFDPLRMVDDQIESITPDQTAPASAQETNEALNSVDELYKQRYDESAQNPFNNIVEESKEENEDTGDLTDNLNDISSDDDIDAGKDEDNSDVDDDTEAPKDAPTEDLKMVDGSSLSFRGLRRTPAWMRRLYNYTDRAIMEYGDGTNTHADEIESAGLADAGDVAILDSEIGPAGESTEPGSVEYDKKRIEGVSNGGAAVNPNRGDNGGSGNDFDTDFGDMGDMPDDFGDMDFGDEENNESPEFRANIVQQLSHYVNKAYPATVIITPRIYHNKLTCTVSIINKNNDNTFNVHNCRRIEFKHLPANYSAMQKMLDRSFDNVLKYSIKAKRKLCAIQFKYDTRFIPNVLSAINITYPNANVKHWPLLNCADKYCLMYNNFKMNFSSDLWPMHANLPQLRGEMIEVVPEVENEVLKSVTLKSVLGNNKLTFVLNEYLPTVLTINNIADHITPHIDKLFNDIGYLFDHENISCLLSGSVPVNVSINPEPNKAYRIITDYINTNTTNTELASLMNHQLAQNYHRALEFNRNNQLLGSWSKLDIDFNNRSFWRDADQLQSKINNDSRLHRTLAGYGYTVYSDSKHYGLNKIPNQFKYEFFESPYSYTLSNDVIVGAEDFVDAAIGAANLAAKAIVGGYRLISNVYKFIRNKFMKSITRIKTILKFWDMKLSTWLANCSEEKLDKITSSFGATCLPSGDWENAFKAAHAGFVLVTTDLLSVIFDKSDDVSPEKMDKAIKLFETAGVKIPDDSKEISYADLKSKVKHDTLQQLGFGKQYMHSLIEHLKDVVKFVSKEGIDKSEANLKACEERFKDFAKTDKEKANKTAIKFNKRITLAVNINKAAYEVILLCIEGALSVCNGFEKGIDAPEKPLSEINPFHRDPYSYEAIERYVKNL